MRGSTFLRGMAREECARARPLPPPPCGPMSSEADDKAFRLYRVRLTAAKMLKNRCAGRPRSRHLPGLAAPHPARDAAASGYNIDESETKLTFEGFKERVRVPASRGGAATSG